MIKFNEFKKIKNRRYTCKEALAYYIESYNYSLEKFEVDEIMTQLLEILLKNEKNNTLLEKIDSDLIIQINNYWILNLDEVIAYAYIIFNNLTKTEQEFNAKDILAEFIYSMKLYSPNNAEEFAQMNIYDN